MNTLNFIHLLTGDPNALMSWRVINDRNAGEQARNFSGSFEALQATLQQYNQSGYGIFTTVNAMDGQGYTQANLSYIRAHVVDLDEALTSTASLTQALNSPLPPHIVVTTSPDKYHLYWLLEPYQDANGFYSLQQRKLAQLFNGDSKIIDSTRVLRVPGFYHCKSEPHLVTFQQIHNNPRYTWQQIQNWLEPVNVIEHFSTRRPLGDPDLKAPSLEWLVFALDELFDPNDMDRGDWLGITAAFKQAGWSHASEAQLLDIWLKWCARYPNNDKAENMKLWNSIQNSEVGWARFERLSNIKAYYFNNPEKPPSGNIAQRIKQSSMKNAADSMPEILDTYNKQIWFKDCYFIEREGKIFSPSGRFMNSTQFNGAYGGKEFVIRAAGGKVTDEAWKAALRSTDWVIPKVDHVRFLPDQSPLTIVCDRRGRRGLNTYFPIIVDAMQGDVSPFLNHVTKILPHESDQKIFLDYMAHIIKYPGYKVPWAVLLQGVEGLGKTVFFEVLQHALGDMYVYRPKAQELVTSGSKFNAWMRAKLAIVVDEIKIDERRELIEILKPMITDKQIEIQAKGIDQEMEDNCANWLFFSNYKDAIPLVQNGRRYCVFYSCVQTKRDKLKAGMDDAYFKKLWSWLRDENGLKIITNWFQNYPLDRGALSVDAPKTSSHTEALRIGRGPLDILIDDKIDAGERGFRNGYISMTMLLKAVEQSSMRHKPAEHVIRAVLNAKGYFELGYTSSPIAGEDFTRPSLIWGLNEGMDVRNYEINQN